MGCTILIIDNDATQRLLLCGALKDHLPCQPVGMANGKEAIDRITTRQVADPDLILMDVSNTTDSCGTISTLLSMTSHCPIVTLVRYGDYETAMDMLKAGAQDFLSKPAAIERISTTLRNMLLLRDARREAEWLRRGNTGTGAGPETAGTAQNNGRHFSFVMENGDIRRMEELEAEAIRFAMHYYDGRMTEVARRLGIGRSTLYRKLNELSLRQQAAVA